MLLLILIPIIYSCLVSEDCGQNKICTDGICTCDTNWDTETNCLTCVENYFGQNCTSSYYECSQEFNELVCNGHGQCTPTINPIYDGIMKCNCGPGNYIQWVEGVNDGEMFMPWCTRCEKDYYGSSCEIYYKPADPYDSQMFSIAASGIMFLIYFALVASVFIIAVFLFFIFTRNNNNYVKL